MWGVLTLLMGVLFRNPRLGVISGACLGDVFSWALMGVLDVGTIPLGLLG